jgi:hypothetical protein
MLAIIDKRSPEKSIQNLKKYVSEVFLFETVGITYNSISCHPDIFIYQNNENLILAPNSPESLIEFLLINKIKFEFGESIIGSKLENSVNYNCISTSKYFIHKLKFTDSKVLTLNKSKVQINVNQAYTACSLIAIFNDIFLTSDKGIFRDLKNQGIEIHYFNPEKIKIFEHKNGFFGGTCGFADNKIFFNGNIDFHENGEEIRVLAQQFNIEIICLNDDYLYDGGKIIFVKA